MKTDFKIDLQNWLQAQMPEAMDWLRRMVGINSLTANAEGVNWLGALTAECFEPLGFKPHFVPSEFPEYGRHLFLSRQGQGKKPVVLVTHLDTVFPPEEEAQNNFHWEETPAESRNYGPGTVDIKGGTVLIWMILGALQKFSPQVFEETSWLIAANASEEVMAKDFAERTSELCPQGAGAVLVFEGGPRKGKEFHIVTSRKGRAEYRISAHGTAAHAGSSHEAGVNAIVSLCDAVKQAAAMTDYARQLTINVGCIQGGTVLNRVPHEACAELEMRAFDPVVLREAGAGLEAIALTAPQKSSAMIAVECLGRSPAWPQEQRTLELFAHWRQAAAELGLDAASVSRGGLSDANYLCHLGPTLDGLGPSGDNAHCSERSADGSKVPEFVETDSFVPKAAMNVLAITRLLGVIKEL
ncbi:MAG: M20/M25/M40 family metallo-hydrolase [Verrucomicrobia bacterium]|nr:M20/M25/M40 family metallo-hydrolase [Verrucomicrobiota bacterium]